MTSSRVYLDHNATTLLRAEARAAIRNALDFPGNPSSIHAEGRTARALIEDVREDIARSFGVSPAAVTFTSGGTEAANWLLQPRGSEKLVLSQTEHPCVLRGHRYGDGDVLFLRVLPNGVVDLEDLKNSLPESSVLAIQAANNETGVVQPLRAIAETAHAKGAIVICDAVQAVGRLPLSALGGADALFFSAHKFGGPKGVGAVITRADLDAPALVRGGGQERRRRSGTENIAGIAGLGAAFTAAIGEQADFAVRADAMRKKLESMLRAMSPDAVIFGEGADRLPNTTCFALPGKQADTLLIAFDLEGVAVSSGSACSSGRVERSHVLAAMGVAPELGAGAIRVSTGWSTTDADVERFLAVLSKLSSDRRSRRTA